MTRTIGVDFDNTIASYDELMYGAAVERGLIADDGCRTKRSVRDRIRLLPDGEIEWQRLQALAYGPMMREARLIDGVDAFIRRCRRAGLAVVIVSHKTEYARYDETRTNLRTASLDWMTAHRFFEADGLGFDPHGVFFESTRADKISRIEAVGCSIFVDDLDEVFLEPSFPAGVEKILYAPDAPGSAAAGVTVMPNWRDLAEYVFDRCA